MARTGRRADLPSPEIRAMNEYIQTRCMPGFALERRARTEHLRRLRIAARARERMVAKVFRAADIDSDQIEKLHRRELATMKRSEKALVQQARAIARKQAGYNREAAVRLSQLWRDVPSPVQTPAVVMLPIADRVDGEVVGTPELASVSNVDSSTGTAGESTLRGRVAIEPPDLDEGADLTLFAHFHFIWPSTLSGLLRMHSWVQADLVYSLGTSPVCAGHTSKASFELQAWLSVGQYNPQGSVSASTAFSPPLVEPSVSRHGGLQDPTQPDPIAGSPFVAEFLSGPSAVPITSGYPVICTTSVVLHVFGFGRGWAKVEFDGQLGIRVPAVILNIE
jgi:hypothetical protein